MISNTRLPGALALSILTIVGAWTVGTGAAQPSSSIKIPFETYTLPNGLTVITSIDRTTPTVAVNMWYHVGSKNEVKGRTGFAHLFEHVMFTGSGHVPYGLHDKLTEGVGGSNNGTTSNDRTTYYETVPSNYLESALWLEADRMGFLLDSLDLEKLNAQRDVVKNERRQSVDNQPYGRAFELLAQATYPASHPYSWDVIGSMEDLSAATEEDVKSFFRLYYAPNNAFLAIVGDFDPAQTKAWVQKYFGDIPRGKAITRPTVAPVTLDTERRLVYEDRVQLPRLYMSVADRRRAARRSLCARRPRGHSGRSAYGAPHEGAGLRQAIGGVGLGRAEHQRRCRRVRRDDHATTGKHPDRSRAGGRSGHREAEGGGADRRGHSESNGGRGAGVCSRTRVQPR